MNVRKLFNLLMTGLVVFLMIPLAPSEPALAQTTIFRALPDFEAAAGPLTLINFEDLDPGATSDPMLEDDPFIPNPLTLEGVTFTDPFTLGTGYCSSPTCQADPENEENGNIVMILDQEATLDLPLGTGGVLLAIEGMGNMPIKLQFTDFGGNSITVEGQVVTGEVTYLGMTSTNGIQEIEVLDVGPTATCPWTPCGPLVLSALYVELNDPDVTIGVWTDPVDDISNPNTDIIFGSATVSEEMIDFRVQFAAKPFEHLETDADKTQDLVWCLDTDQDPDTGNACGQPGADQTFTLSGELGALFGGEFSFTGALSGVDPCSVGAINWDTNTLRFVIPRALLTTTGAFNYAMSAAFKSESGNITIEDLAPASPNFGTAGGFFTTSVGELAPFNGVPLCSANTEASMLISMQAAGTVELFPELGVLQKAPVSTAIQSVYFKTTAINRQFRRGFFELTVPAIPSEARIAKATLILTESRARTSYPKPPVTHEISYYTPADLVITTDDYSRTMTLLPQTIETDENEAERLFAIDVTEAIQSSEGNSLGFRIKMAADPTETEITNYGTSFRTLNDDSFRILVKLCQAESIADATSGGTLTYVDDGGLITEIEVPAEAVNETTELFYTAEEAPADTAPLSGMQRMGYSELLSVDRAFTLDTYQGGTRKSEGVFQNPITVTLHYDDSDVTGLNENTLTLNRWNGSKWEYAACGPYERHPGENWLAVPVCEPSEFALFGTREQRISGLGTNGPIFTPLGQVTHLTSTVTGGTNVVYTWDFGDGTTGSGAMVTHTYDVGTYTAVVTASNGAGQATSTARVTVEAPVSGLSALNSGPTELGQATLLTASVTGGSNVTYAWDFGDSTSSSGALINHTYDVGTYTAVVTASNGVSQDTASTTVIVEAPITALAATSSNPTMLGQATVLTAAVKTGSNVSYVWDFGDGTSGSGALINHTYDVGTYTAVVTASNGVSRDTASTTVIVEAPIDGLTAISSSPTTLSNTTTLTAAVKAGSNVTYAWDFGDGATGEGPVGVHTYPAAGTYTATVTASNHLHSFTATAQVRIIDVPISGLVASTESHTTLGSPTTLTATVTAGSGEITYQWALGDCSSASGAVVSHIYPAAGSYTAVVTATNSSAVLTASIVVDITQTPQDNKTYVYLPMIERGDAGTSASKSR